MLLTCFAFFVRNVKKSFKKFNFRENFRNFLKIFSQAIFAKRQMIFVSTLVPLLNGKYKAKTSCPVLCDSPRNI
jgi:hypothetical protein